MIILLTNHMAQSITLNRHQSQHQYCTEVLLIMLLCEYSTVDTRRSAVMELFANGQWRCATCRDCLLLVALHSLWFHPERWTWLGHTETCRQMHAFPSARWMSSWNRGVLPSLIPCEADYVTVTRQEKKQDFFIDSSDVNPSSIEKGHWSRTDLVWMARQMRELDSYAGRKQGS